MTSRISRRIALCAAAAMVVASCASGETETRPSSSAAAPETSAPVTSESSAVSVASVATEPETSSAIASVDIVEGTERWSAVVIDFAYVPDHGHEVTIGLSTQDENSDLIVTPFAVELQLLGEWASCEIEADSWSADVSPAVHPRAGIRTWELHPRETVVTENADGSGTLRVEYRVVSDDESATLVITGTISPGCVQTDEPDSDETVTQPSGSGTDDASDDASDAASSDGSEQDDTVDDPDGDTSDTGQDADADTDESDTDDNGDSDTDEPTTTEPQRVQLRRWDHQALIDLPLWAHCPPEVWPSWLTERLDGFDLTWAGWDNEVVELNGYHVASGWWTDEQLAMWLPGSGIDAETARENATYHPNADSVGLWSVTVAPVLHEQGTPRTLTTLRAAMEHRGHNLDSFAAMLRATSRGISGTGAWPEHIDRSNLLTSWMRFRYAQPPTTTEPVAWPLRSLFEAHEAGCVADALVVVCTSEETPDAMLEPQHQIGRVLRSLACGQ